MSHTKTLKILASNFIKDTRSNLISSDIVIPEGIKCIETDTNKYKIGDGIHIYHELEYVTVIIDTEPIENSMNPITSGGVYNVLGDISTILDSINRTV
jgi:hypothetical protein